ncbi:MAG: N-formylglutamate amidohydrolase [Alphaproteobacteria bacterium]|nr:N-formylglutamate amidohydrolase [Rhodospirillales bacterium]MCW9045644.1 N-formylglutamate amidohydrolase [Alphaproteobacteria bacterium]
MHNLADVELPKGHEQVYTHADGPLFEFLNPEGVTPLLLICDHASQKIPTPLDNLGLSQNILKDHIAWDIGAAEVTRRAAKRLKCSAMMTGFSRLVIDCNRQPGDPGSIPSISDGVTVPRNQNLGEEDEILRSETFFVPYHHAITAQVAHLWRHGPAPALFSIHSFTPEMDGKKRPWDAGVLWNRDPRIAMPLLNSLRHHKELNIGDNEPYSGKDIAYSIDRHGGAAGLPNCAIEIRQDLIDHEEGIEKWSIILASALSDVLNIEGLHQVEHF